MNTSEKPIEVWVPIPMFEGYEASNYCRIKSPNGKILAQRLRKDGYKDIKIKEIRFLAHKLVLPLFIPQPYGLNEINHKDENKANNFIFVNQDGTVDPEKSNLEWCDRQYNVNYGTAVKRRSRQVKAVRKKDGVVVGTFISVRSASLALNVQSRTIQRQIDGKRDFKKDSHKDGYYFYEIKE